MRRILIYNSSINLFRISAMNRPAAPISADSVDALPRAIPAEALFRGASVVLIEHKGEHYQLRITRNGKLILTK